MSEKSRKALYPDLRMKKDGMSNNVYLSKMNGLQMRNVEGLSDTGNVDVSMYDRVNVSANPHNRDAYVNKPDLTGIRWQTKVNTGASKASDPFGNTDEENTILALRQQEVIGGDSLTPMKEFVAITQQGPAVSIHRSDYEPNYGSAGGSTVTI